MYTKQQLMQHMADMGIDPKGTLLIHSSMKSIGEVEGGADTVLDAIIEYMKEGLLILPTHTWAQISLENPVFHAATEPSCVGLLTNMFMKRPGVVRSLHPTHSVAAIGREAAEYVKGEELTTSPCPREGCWGRLYDRKAQILMLGVGLGRYTFMHSVEEWLDIPNRLTEEPHILYTIAPDGTRYTVPQHRHMYAISDFFVKMDDVYLESGAMKRTKFGDANCLLCDSVKTADIAVKYLSKYPALFSDSSPLPPLE